MANILKDLTLEEISLVDVPANPLASVPLFKRHTGEDMTDNTNWEEVAKALEVEKTDLATQLTDKDAKIEELTKALEDAAKIEKADDTIDFDGEKISKSLIPAPVLKRLEEVQKAQETLELHKRAEELLPNFKGTLEQRAKLLKSIDFDKELLELLAAADKLFSANYEEVGKSDVEGSMLEPEAKLDKLAKAYAAEKNTTFEKGYAAVIKTAEGKSLYKETLKK